MCLAERGMFPTDLYILEGLIKQLGRRHTLRLVAPADVCGAVDDDTALVVLQHVAYSTGALHDMRGVTAAAHAKCAPCPAHVVPSRHHPLALRCPSDGLEHCQLVSAFQPHVPV